MDTLIKVHLNDIIEDYPNQAEVEKFTPEELNELIAELKSIAHVYPNVKKFPGGVEGYLLFLLLSKRTTVSAQEDDFEDHCWDDLNIYKYFYQKLYTEVACRFEEAFESIDED